MLARNAQVLVARTNGDDEAARLNLLALNAQGERAAGEVRASSTREKFDTRSESGRPLLHLGHELRASDPSAKAGIILHNRGRGEQPAWLHPGYDEWIQVGAGSVDGGCPPSTYGANDDDVFHNLARRVPHPFLRSHL